MSASLSASLRRQIRERKSRQDGPSDAQIAQAFDLGFRHPAWPEDLTPAYRLRISVVIATGHLCTHYLPKGLPVLVSCARTAGQLSIEESTEIVEVMRETCLKCISFVGVPKIINCLAELMSGLQAEHAILDGLSRLPRRALQPENIADVERRGRDYWEAVYTPHHLKLEHKLGEYCPDLPIHILQCHYAALLSPFEPEQRRPWDLDRVSSSVLAVTCLRAQDGLERQVESHVFGLKKASSACEGPEKWLTTDDGCMWLLDTIDEMSDLLVPSP